MKRFGYLFEKIVTLLNLDLAEKKARKGKSRRGEVKLFLQNREENLKKLQLLLINGEYHTSEYKTFYIYEPKERLIYKLPYYPDRIVHHAIMNILEPIWIKTLPYNTYSCIKGRGIHGCYRQVKKIFGQFKGKDLYCLKIDIKKYYPSIDNNILKIVIMLKIKDPKLLLLLNEIIDSTKGVPIGNYLSLFFANLYLSEFIHIINEKYQLKCTAYADDIVIYADNKKLLHLLLHEFIILYLKDKRHLSIKDNYQIFKVSNNRYDKSGRALDYLGYKFYRNCILVRNAIKHNLIKKISKITTSSIKKFKILISPWLGWMKSSNSRYLLYNIIPKLYEGIFCRKIRYFC